MTPFRGEGNSSTSHTREGHSSNSRKLEDETERPRDKFTKSRRVTNTESDQDGEISPNREHATSTRNTRTSLNSLLEIPSSSETRVHDDEQST